MSGVRVLVQWYLLSRVEKRLILEVRVADLGQSVDRIIIGISEASQLIPRLRCLEVKNVGAKLVASPFLRASVDEAAQIVLGRRLQRHVEDLCIAQRSVNLVGGPTECYLGLEVGFLGPPALHCVNLGGHSSREGEQFLVASKPVKLADTLQLKRVAFVVGRLPTLELITHLGRVHRLVAKDFEHDRVSFKALVIGLEVRDPKLASVLQDAHDVRVTRVLVAAVESAMAHGFVLAADVGLVHSYLYKALRIL